MQIVLAGSCEVAHAPAPNQANPLCRKISWERRARLQSPHQVVVALWPLHVLKLVHLIPNPLNVIWLWLRLYRQQFFQQREVWITLVQNCQNILQVRSAHVLCLVCDLVLNIRLKPVVAQVQFSSDCIQISDSLSCEGSIAFHILSDRNLVLLFACIKISEFILNFLLELSIWYWSLEASQSIYCVDQSLYGMQVIDGGICWFTESLWEVAGPEEEIVRFSEKLRGDDVAEIPEIWHVLILIIEFIFINIES